MNPAQWREVIDINLNGVFYCLQGIIPMLKSQRAGAIVAFTSGLALTGWPGASAYAASKAALIGMIKSAAHELKDFNVRANVLSPGVRATPIFMDVSTEAEREHYRGIDRHRRARGRRSDPALPDLGCLGEPDRSRHRAPDLALRRADGALLILPGRMGNWPRKRI